jgi:hypothetical protein
MELLDEEETLILAVARATCFSYRLDRDNTPQEDLDTYVDELLRLYLAKPRGRAATNPSDPEHDVRSAVAFCAQQLAESSPEHAARLRRALDQQ